MCHASPAEFVATLLTFAEPNFADDWANEVVGRMGHNIMAQTLTFTAACKLFDDDC